MTCQHGSGLRCYECAPELWEPPAEETAKTNRRIYQTMVINLIDWNRAYRAGEPMVEDARYDLYETSLRERYPEHPLFSMVDHDETKVEECLAYLSEKSCS